MSQSNVAPALNAVTAARDQEAAGELDLPDQRSTRSPLLTDGDGSSGSCAESSTESAHELGKQMILFFCHLNNWTSLLDTVS